MRIKQAAVAGMFYPDDSVRLQTMVQTLLDDNCSSGTKPEALLVPHAGLIYSGGIAARAYNRLSPWLSEFCRIVILGPNHRLPLTAIAAMDADLWRTPTADIPLDNRLTSKLVDEGFISFNNPVHAQEHCLEVQLPFLSNIISDQLILPLVVGQCPAYEVAALIARLRQEPGTLIIISSDLSHFHPYDEAVAIDSVTMEKIGHLQSDIAPQQACGCYALNGLLTYARQQGWQAESLSYCNSGDSAGDRSRVVGYGAYAFYR